MYGKLFTQMYDGTLATKGPWQAMVTFQQLIILADKDGVVDMTAEAISRRTTIPLDIIKIGITALEQDDTESRTPTEKGRRIIRLSIDRDWGWRIVNHEHYRKIRSQEERREYMRNYQQNRRKHVNKIVNNVSNVNPCSKQYTDTKAVDLDLNHPTRQAEKSKPIDKIPGQPQPTKLTHTPERAKAIAESLSRNDQERARALSNHEIDP